MKTRYRHRIGGIILFLMIYSAGIAQVQVRQPVGIKMGLSPIPAALAVWTGVEVPLSRHWQLHSGITGFRLADEASTSGVLVTLEPRFYFWEHAKTRNIYIRGQRKDDTPRRIPYSSYPVLKLYSSPFLLGSRISEQAFGVTRYNLFGGGLMLGSQIQFGEKWGLEGSFGGGRVFSPQAKGAGRFLGVKWMPRASLNAIFFVRSGEKKEKHGL